MAVENKYVDANRAAGLLVAPWEQAGHQVCLTETFEVAVADDDGSVFRIARVSGDLIPVRIFVYHDSITNGTDYDLGIYLAGPDSAVKDVDALMSAQDLSTGARNVDGMAAVDVADIGQTIFELAGDTASSRSSEYDLAFTGQTVGSAAGTVTIVAFFVHG